MPKKSVSGSIFTESALVFIYACLGLAYFVFIDQKFYLKNVLNSDIAFAWPIPYILLTAAFVFLYSGLFKADTGKTAWPVAGLAAALPLFYLSAEMMIGMRTISPFGGNRELYGIYAVLYFGLVVTVFSLVAGHILRRRLGPVFTIPLLVYFAYIEGLLLFKGCAVYAAISMAAFLYAVSSDSLSMACRQVKNIFIRIFSDEKILLAAIFMLAFLIRYFWGERLLGITGSRFIMASDDGPCYDEYASLLAGGQIIPKEGIYSVSGFSYWYFLGAIYKVFGLHNFRAVFAVQAFIGSFVPVLTYLIAKKVSGTRVVPVVAAIIACLDMNLIYLSVVIGMEAIYIPLVMMAIAVSAYKMSRGGLDYKKTFLIGCAFGIAYTARPPELLLFPVILAFIIALFMKKNSALQAIMRAVISLFIGFILLGSAQYLTNYAVYGERLPALQGAAAASFKAGVAEGAHVDENKALGQMGFNPFEDYKRSVSILARNPVTVSALIAKGFIKRLVLLYFLPNFGVFDPVYIVNPGSGYFFRFPVYLQLCASIITIAGIFAAFQKKYRVTAILLFAFLAYISCRVAFFFVLNARYRGVLLPVLGIFFAYGLRAFIKKIKCSYEKGVC